MPTIKSAEKRRRQAEKRRERNGSVRSQIRTRTRRIREADSRKEAEKELGEAYALLDRAARKGVLHPSAAARKKSQLARHVESL